MNIRCRFLTNFNICRKFWSQFQKSSQLLLIQWCQFSNNFVFRNLDICQKPMSTIHVVWACCVCVFSRNLQMTYGLFKGHWQKIISGRVVFLVVTDRFSTRVEKKSEMRKKRPWKTITVSCLMPLHFPSEKKLREERGRRGFISWDKIKMNMKIQSWFSHIFRFVMKIRKSNFVFNFAYIK